MTDAGKLYEQLQAARTELRHQAHIYANCKHKDKLHRDEAAERLENAAVVVTLLAAQWGMRAGCARPAGKAGRDWEDRLDPETALQTRDPRHRIVAHMMASPEELERMEKAARKKKKRP